MCEKKEESSLVLSPLCVVQIPVLSFQSIFLVYIWYTWVSYMCAIWHVSVYLYEFYVILTVGAMMSLDSCKWNILAVFSANYWNKLAKEFTEVSRGHREI